MNKDLLLFNFIILITLSLFLTYNYTRLETLEKDNNFLLSNIHKKEQEKDSVTKAFEELSTKLEQIKKDNEPKLERLEKWKQRNQKVTQYF